MKWWMTWRCTYPSKDEWEKQVEKAMSYRIREGLISSDSWGYRKKGREKDVKENRMIFSQKEVVWQIFSRSLDSLTNQLFAFTFASSPYISSLHLSSLFFLSSSLHFHFDFFFPPFFSSLLRSLLCRSSLSLSFFSSSSLWTRVYLYFFLVVVKERERER